MAVKRKIIATTVIATLAFGTIQPADATPEQPPNSAKQEIADSKTIGQDLAGKDEFTIGGETFTDEDRTAIRQEVAEANLGEPDSQNTQEGIAGWVRKAVLYILRHNKDRLPKKVQPWSGKIVSILEQVEVWEMFSIQVTLIQQGVPPDVAEAFAYWIVFVFGV